jgi:hypothetical protein
MEDVRPVGGQDFGAARRVGRGFGHDCLQVRAAAAAG